jgi:hypothetical protein
MTIAPTRLTDDLAGQRQELSSLSRRISIRNKALETGDAFILAHWALTFEGFLARLRPRAAWQELLVSPQMR